MILTVKKDGTGDFLSVQRAVDAAVPGDEIILFPGVYEERVIVDKPGLTVRGVSREQAEHTVLRARACAKDLDSGGKEKGTFLSYTLLVSAPEVCLRDDQGTEIHGRLLSRRENRRDASSPADTDNTELSHTAGRISKGAAQP